MVFLRNLLWSAGAAALASAATAALLSRIENRRAAPAINAVSHIAWGGPAPYHAGNGGKNFWMGAGLHAGASLFWAAIFEAVFGRAAHRSRGAALLAGAITSASACIADYRIVSQRFRPGFEAYLSRPSLLAVYIALAGGLALGARAAARLANRRAARAGGGSVHFVSRGAIPSHTIDSYEAASFTRLKMP